MGTTGQTDLDSAQLPENDAVDSVYGLSMSYHPRHDSVLYAFTTAPREWSARWDQAAYIEVDPRISARIRKYSAVYLGPNNKRCKSVRQDEFLDDAGRFGIRSGVSFLLSDSDHASVIMALSSNVPHLDDKKRSDIRDKLGICSHSVTTFTSCSCARLSVLIAPSGWQVLH